MGATYSHVCRAHSLFYPAFQTISDKKVHARMRTPKQALIGPKGLQAKQELGIAAIESQRPGAFL
jgi:hypothetical protein